MILSVAINTVFGTNEPKNFGIYILSVAINTVLDQMSPKAFKVFLPIFSTICHCIRGEWVIKILSKLSAQLMNQPFSDTLHWMNLPNNYKFELSKKY